MAENAARRDPKISALLSDAAKLGKEITLLLNKRAEKLGKNLLEESEELGQEIRVLLKDRGELLVEVKNRLKKLGF